MLDPRCIPTVVGIVAEGDFAFSELRLLFREIVRVWQATNGYVDGALVRSRLEALGEPTIQLLREVLDSTPSAAAAAYYAHRVVGRSRYRQVVEAVRQAQERLVDGGETEEIVQDVRRLVGRLQDGSEATVHHVRDHATAAAIATQDDALLVRTGFRSVDRLAGGVCPGELCLVAARPSAGKSAFMSCWALRAARAGQGVAIFTLEMTARALMERMAAVLGHVALAPIKRRTQSPAQLDRFYGGALELATLPVRIVEAVTTVERMEMILEQVRQQEPVGVVFLDYLQLLSGEGRNRNEQISQISRSLKLMAGRSKVAVVALSQLNRATELRQGHRPQMGDLRDSGSLEQDADMILMLHREDYYRKQKDPTATNLDGLADVIVAKARNGPTGTAKLLFIDDEMRFEELCDEAL